MRKAFKVIKQSWGLLKDHPLLALPLVLFALTEGIVLYLLFLAPQEPFAKLLTPPITRFLGEQSIRYPNHILILPKVFNFTKLYFLDLLLVFLSALLIGLIGYIQFGRNTSLRYHVKILFHRFFSLFSIWLLNLGVLKLIEVIALQAFGWGDSKVYLTSIKFLFYFLSFWVQILFLYALPLIILAEKSLFKALIGNFRYLWRLFLPTTVFIFLAALLYLGIFIFQVDYLMDLANRTLPEIIVVSMTANILFTLVINLFITTTTTLLFIDEQETDPKTSLVTGKEKPT